MSGRWVSRVLAGTGPRGSGKTLWLTVQQYYALIKAFYLGFKVWSNYPVGFYHYDPFTAKKVYLYSMPLNMSALYTFSKELTYGWVFIDEIDKWLDRQEWAAGTSRIIVQVLTMIRKRHISLGLSIQDLEWLNNRAQFQTDVEVNCRDAAFSQWGRSVGLQNGEIVNQVCKDLSGTYTGFMYHEDFMVYRRNMRAKWAWPIYNTDQEFNPMEEKTAFSMKKREIEYDPISGDLIDKTAIKRAELERFNNDLMLFSDLIIDVKNQGYEQIEKAHLKNLAFKLGIDITDPRKLTSLLGKFNVDSTSRVYYDLRYTNISADTHGADIPPYTPENKLKELVGV